MTHTYIHTSLTHWHTHTLTHTHTDTPSLTHTLTLTHTHTLTHTLTHPTANRHSLCYLMLFQTSSPTHCVTGSDLYDSNHHHEGSEGMHTLLLSLYSLILFHMGSESGCRSEGLWISWYQWLYCWGWPCAHSMRISATVSLCYYHRICFHWRRQVLRITPIDIIQAQVSISHSTTWWTVVVLETRRQWSRGVAPQEGTVLGNWPCVCTVWVEWLCVHNISVWV